MAYGLLVSLLFTLWPLGRAEQVRAGVLFRDEVAPERVLPRWRILALTLARGAAAGGARDPHLRGAACSRSTTASAWSACSPCSWRSAAPSPGRARRVPRPRRPELALAIGNLGAPGGLTRSVVLSLGAGLSLLVTVALVDRSIVAELTGRLPEESPNYFVLDVKRSESDAFHALVAREAPAAKVREAPMLRGRMVKLGDRPAEQVKAPPEVQWVLNGDRGLTYSQTRARRARRVVAGTWWPADYAGEPLVSFEAEIAKGLGLKIGDTVTVNVLGRNVTARIANLREVKWESLALNFVLVFSPNTLAGAPHNLLATITLPKDAPARRRGQARPADRPRLPGLHRHPRQGRHRRLQRHLQPRHGGRAGGRQRHLARRRPGAGRRAGHRPAPPHPAGRDPEDARRHQPPHPALAPGRVRWSWRS